MSLDDWTMHRLLEAAADTYEQLAALPPATVIPAGRRPGKPGSRVPPGMNEILDLEEHERTITGVDEWALYLARHVLDETGTDERITNSTPGRLRFAARWADVLEQEPDLMARYAFHYDAVEHLKALRRLIGRTVRAVPTGSACMDVACAGTYRATITGPDVDGDLVCDRCRSRVSQDQWSRWGSQAEWVTVAHAARMLGIPISTVRVWAHRYGWDRQGKGKYVRYRADHVQNKRTPARKRHAGVA